VSAKVKLGLLLLGAISIVACPLAATGAEQPEGVFTLFRVLVGQPQASEGGPARVLVIPGPFIFLGKSAEQDARDVLQLMDRLKASYGLAEVSIANTSPEAMTPQKEAGIPVPGGDLSVVVTLLDFDATKAAYRVRLTKRGEQPSETTIVVNRGERGLIGTRDGSLAPYLFLTIEPLSYPAHETNAPAVMPKLITKVQPTYPPDARMARVAGVVILEATIGTDGAVHHLRAFRSEPMGLTEAAMEAVKQWRYDPAKDASGKPVEAVMNVTISFMLR
jgi:TonB family protein